MKILIAIVSCRKHRDAGYHDAIRNTWVRDIPQDVHYRFFYGGQGTDPLQDECELNVDDSYEGLFLKSREICRWAWDQGYDFIHKTDTDTVVHVSNLLNSDFSQYDYTGGENADNLPAAVGSGRIEFASGGAGYWLSRKALAVLCHARETGICGEDVYVALLLREAGILPIWNAGYRWRPGETIDKEIISLHLSSALQKKYASELMHEYYTLLRSLT